MQQQASASAAAKRARVRQLRLYTEARGPAGYETKWDELHPMSQSLLLRIEEKLGEYKYQSQQLDQCSTLHDPSLYNKSFELNASQTVQEVRSTSTVMDREKVFIRGLTGIVKEMLWNINIALHSYVKLRPRFVQRGPGGAAGFVNFPGSSGGYTEFNQRLTKAPNICYYSDAPRRPSPFIQLTVARFEERIGECFKWAEELESLVQMKNDKSFPESLESLSKVMSNTHDYFIHVASKLEDIHQAVEAMKTRYLNDRRCRGCWDDPFNEADTRESAKQEATVRMVHPTLHLSPQSQPTTSVTASVMASQLHQNSFPIRGTLPSSCPTLLPPLLLPTSSTQPSPAPIPKLLFVSEHHLTEPASRFYTAGNYGNTGMRWCPDTNNLRPIDCSVAANTKPSSDAVTNKLLNPFSINGNTGGTAVQASRGSRTNKGKPPRSRR